MNCKSFTVTSNGGFFDYPLPPESPFRARISLRGVDALTEIGKTAASEKFVTCTQVHGARVIAAAEAPSWPLRERADGIFILQGDPVSGLRFGDCAPVIVLCTEPQAWVLLLHSGFRGTLLDIVASGFDFARSRACSFDEGSLDAWVGPCISGACYTRRLDDPTTAEAVKRFSPDAVKTSGELVHFDLKLQIARQLAAQGVPEGRIRLERQCTCCRTDLFCSHRRSTPGNDPRMLLTVRS